MKKLFDIFIFWRSVRIVLAHHKIIPPLTYQEKPSPTALNQSPAIVLERITHEELIAAHGGLIYALWDFFKD